MLTYLHVNGYIEDCGVLIQISFIMLPFHRIRTWMDRYFLITLLAIKNGCGTSHHKVEPLTCESWVAREQSHFADQLKGCKQWWNHFREYIFQQKYICKNLLRIKELLYECSHTWLWINFGELIAPGKNKCSLSTVHPLSTCTENMEDIHIITII